MPRSSRHKSSKHSPRDYSDSEKDSGLKEKDKRSKDESSVKFLKDPESGAKRKLDSGGKNLSVSENGDCVEEYSSSKRRKDKAVDGVSSVRCNGGEDDDGKGVKKSRASSESKSKRRDDAEGEDTKKGKSEGKHRESTGKEEREREKKGKEGKSDEHRSAKQSTERNDLDIPDRLQSPESESQLEKRLRKRRDASGDGDKNLEDNGETLDRQLSVSNDTVKYGRAKDEKYKDEKYKEKYREDTNCEDKCQNDKLRDDRSASDHANSKSSEKNLRDGKDVKVRQKKSKVQDSEFEREAGHDRKRERDRDRERYRERKRDMGRDRERERYRDLDRDHYQERDRNRDHDHDRDYESQLDRDRERDRRYSDRDRDRDRDELHDERRSARYKDSKGRKQSPDDRDDGNDTKSRGAKGQYSDMENKSSISGRVEVDADGGRSRSRPANLDAAMGSNMRASPSPSFHGGTDEYRHLKQEDSKYRDPMTEQRSKAALSREVTSFSETPERGAKYRSIEKSSRVDEGHSGELQNERSSSFKASPKSLMEKSPSTSLERRYTSRSGVRRGLDIEETGWSSASVCGRGEDNRLSRDLPPEKPLLDGSSQADSVFYNRAGQGNSSLIPQQPGLRAGIGSPSFMGSLEEDNRFNNSGRYKRSGDMNVRRGHANGWRGAPNWPGPVPNGFIPFQPPHGGFQAMMPQFPSPSLFGARPSMEINHSGIPYHIPDAERFNNHLRPMGWQNMMDGSGPAHFHSWDGHNFIFRDEAHMFGGSEWDQNRHPVNGRGWDASSDVWKGQNGDVDLTSTSQKEDHPLQAPVDDGYDGQERQRSQYENESNGVQVKGLEIRSDVMSPVKDSSRVSPEVPHKACDSSKLSSEHDDAHYCQLYLSKLDISVELAGSDLYDLCMGLLTVERSKDLAKDVAKLGNLKNGARSVQNASIAVRSPSLIPAANASVFQKAMDLYKKQRLEMGSIPNVNGGMVALASAPKENGKERCSDHHVVGEAEEPALISDTEMVDSAMLDSDEQKGEVVPTATLHENMEQLVSIQRRESPDHLDSLSPEKSELPNTDFGHMSPEVPNPVLDGNKTEETETEQLNSGGVVVDPLQSLDKAVEAVGLAANVENPNDINETEGNSSVFSGNEKHAFGDATSGSLNDSPKESGGLIPGSNESGSESVILSRIHHSPENTH